MHLYRSLPSENKRFTTPNDDKKAAMPNVPVFNTLRQNPYDEGALTRNRIPIDVLFSVLNRLCIDRHYLECRVRRPTTNNQVYLAKNLVVAVRYDPD